MSGDGCPRGQADDIPPAATPSATRLAVRCCDGAGGCSSDPGGGCLPDGATHAEAEAACAAQGRRLCTVRELEAGVCCDAACGYDDRRVWTSTSAGAWLARRPSSALPSLLKEKPPPPSGEASRALLEGEGAPSGQSQSGWRAVTGYLKAVGGGGYWRLEMRLGLVLGYGNAFGGKSVQWQGGGEYPPPFKRFPGGKEEAEGHRVVRGRWAPPPTEGKGPREGQ